MVFLNSGNNEQKFIFENFNKIRSTEFYCPMCKSSNSINDGKVGEIVCGKCGFVLITNMKNREPEWKAYTINQKMSNKRVGSPINYLTSDKGLSTNIDWKNRDAKGKNIPIKRKLEINRIRKWNKRIQVFDSKQRNLTLAMTIIKKIGSKMNLPKKVLEFSSLIYRKALKKNIIQGRKIKSIAIASIYLACRIYRLNKRIRDFSKKSSVNIQNLSKSYRLLIKKLKIEVPLFKTTSLITRICNEFLLDGKVEILANNILETLKKLKMTCGKAPSGTAASIIYISSILMGQKLTQREIASIIDISVPTLRKRYKEIINSLNIFITL
jgi:transcription initiation factor TFIIB